MIGIPLGLVYANALEWTLHKYVLHGLGKKRSSFWAFHFHDHHRNARKHAFRDPDYERSLFGWHAQSKEALALLAGVATHLPLFPVAPFFTATTLYAAANYYRKHKRAHLDPEWGRTRLPWHWDHHMGRNPNMNWGVTRPWFDHILGTREPMEDR